MKILITGGAGFIGSNFIRKLLEGELENIPNIETLTVLDSLDYSGNVANLAPVSQDPRFVFIQGDIGNTDLVTRIMPDHQLIIHFAAKSHVDRSINNAHPFFETNVLGTQVLLNAALISGVTTFVHVSTDEVYGTITAGSWTEDSQLLPNSPYAASKAGSDLLARSYWRTFGMDVRITRCSNNYGPYQHPEKAIPLFITNLLENKSIPVYGDGLNIRDWLHVDDHCRAIWLVALKGAAGEVYNIGGGRELSNIDLASTILGLLGKDKDSIQFVEDRKGHDLRYSLDHSKISRELGYQPQITFQEGIISTVNWYQENNHWWKPLKS